jgi:predicted DNA-binding transcriptional regulator YafY
MRADRLLRLLLLLQTRGRATAQTLADELEVSIRTVYRDLEALSAAGVPVYAESGPGGGCQLVDGYTSPLHSLTEDEASALLLLGVPEALTELGLHSRRTKHATIHLDMPRWFHTSDETPHLPTLAEALRNNKKLILNRGRTVDPLGLVNKAGIWYLVAKARSTRVFRVSRITAARVSNQKATRPKDFDLVTFWTTWTEEFEGSRPSITVRIRAKPDAWPALKEIFGTDVTDTLRFEHEGAAAYRLAGFGDLIEVVEPAAVRQRVIETAQAIIKQYG